MNTRKMIVKMITRSHWVAFVLAAALLCGTASTASAQYYGRPRHYYVSPYGGPTYRSGLVIGGGIGFGALSADQCGDLCGGALSLEGHIGGMVDPRLAMMFDAWTTIHPIPGSDGETTNTLYTGALQFWPIPVLWLKGGVGLGNTQIRSNSIGTRPGSRCWARSASRSFNPAGSRWICRAASVTPSTRRPRVDRSPISPSWSASTGTRLDFRDLSTWLQASDFGLQSLPP